MKIIVYLDAEAFKMARLNQLIWSVRRT